MAVVAETRRTPDFSSLTPRELVTKRLETERLETILLDRVITENALIDDQHADELGASMEQKRGQITPIAVRARLNNEGLIVYDIIDGFHRAEGKKRKGGTEIKANVLYGCSDEEMYDLRVLAASSVRSVQFPRLAEWMTKSWETTSWAKNGLSVTQAFVKTIDDRERTRLTSGVRLTPEELNQLKDWVKAKCRRWGRGIHSTYLILKLVSESDPDLVRQVRLSSGAKDREGKITPARLKVVVENFPGEQNFRVQRAILKVIVDKRLTADEAKQLADEAKDWVNPRMSEETIYKVASQVKLYPVYPQPHRGITPAQTHTPRKTEQKGNGVIIGDRTIILLDKQRPGKVFELREEAAINEDREPTDEDLQKIERGDDSELDELGLLADEKDPEEFGKGNAEDRQVLLDRIKDLEQALENAKKNNGSSIDTWWRTAPYLTPLERAVFERVMYANEDYSRVCLNLSITELQLISYIRSAFAKKNLLDTKRRAVP